MQLRRDGIIAEKIRFAVMGMGNRGTIYASRQLQFPEEMEITAIDRSTESHYLAFAAEYSRTHGGVSVDVGAFAEGKLVTLP